MFAILINAALLSVAILLVEFFPLLSVLIVLFSCFYMAVADFSVSPVRSMFLFSYSALFLLGVVFQIVLEIPFGDKFGLFGSDIVLSYLYMAIGFVSIFIIVSKLLDFILCKESVGCNYIANYDGVKKVCQYYPLVMVFIAMLFVINYGGIGNIVSMTRVDLGASRGSESILALYASYFLLPAYFICGVVAGRMKNDRLIFFYFFTACIFFSVMLFLVFRIRTFMVAHLFSYFIGRFWSHVWVFEKFGYFDQKKATRKSGRYLKILLSMFALIVVAVFFRFQRGAIESDGGGGYDADVLRSIVELTFLGGDLGYHLIVMRVMQFVDVGLLNAAYDSLIRIVLSFVPNGLFFDKPIDPQIAIGRLFDPYLGNFTVPPGVIGDFYMTYGDWWPFASVLFSLLFWFFDKNKSPVSIVFYGSIFSTLFHFTRGAASNSVLIFIVTFLGSWFMVKLIGAKKL